MKYLIFLIPLLFSLSCQKDISVSNIILKEIPIACKEGGESNLFSDEKGDLFLSWVEYINDSTDVLQYAELKNNEWTNPQEISRGSDWFVNWADFPSLCKSGDNLAAQWLQKSASGVYDYDVRISINENKSKWSESFIPHRDSIPSEHGFVTMLPLENGRFFATWLDGRNTKGEGHGDHGHGHGTGGAMTLRTAEFNSKGELKNEFELDNRVCDCCQTDAVKLNNNYAVVYRDRSEKEIRDISFSKFDGGNWTLPKTIHSDNWKITGCPVNGPAIAAFENQLAVVWFTAPENDTRVNLSFSENEGNDFSIPIRLDDGVPEGRVDIEWLDENRVLVIWMENIEDQAEIRAKIIDKKGKISESFSLHNIHQSRRSGFPVLAKNNNRFYLSWTHVENKKTKIKTGEIVLE